MPGPCRLGRVHELGEQLVVACAVVGPVTRTRLLRTVGLGAPPSGALGLPSERHSQTAFLSLSAPAGAMRGPSPAAAASAR